MGFRSAGRCSAVDGGRLSGNTDEHRVIDAVPDQLFIGGSWRPARSDATIPVVDPSTGTPLGEAADGGPEDGLDALAAAYNSQEALARVPPRERADILRRAYELMVSRIDDLALLVTLEMGKPLAEARGEALYAAEFFRWFSEEAVRIEGGYQIAPSGMSRFLVHRQPVGVCMMITPWNFPLAMGTRKIGPAIAAGCAVVMKPAPQTPLSMNALAAILHEAGLPAGALNVVSTSSAGAITAPILADPRCRKLSFTGSTAVGSRLLQLAAGQVLRTSMELGGNAPFVVFEDADLDAAVDGAIIAKMRNAGQACTAANRFLVHHSVAAEYVERLVARVDELVVGRGTAPEVQIGPLIDDAAVRKVSALVDDATEHGAEIVGTAKTIGLAGHFYPPTVLTNVSARSRIGTEEIFGPVAALATFESEDEAVSAANASNHGLVAYLFTHDLSRALRVSERLEFGMVGLNTGLVSDPAAPFGGVKQSGLGREGGRVGIDEYLETKYVGISVLPNNATQP